MLLKLTAVIAAMLAGMSLFSSLRWLIRLRISAVVLVGMVLIGLLGWQLIKPLDTEHLVRFPSLPSAVYLLILAAVTGFIASFLSWPYGDSIGILAVPAGLAVWSVRSVDIATVMQRIPDVTERYKIIAQSQYTGLLWLLVVAVGFCGVLLGQCILGARDVKIFTKPIQKVGISEFSNILTALIGSVLIALFCVKIFAQDIKLNDPKLGSVIGQPSIAQLAFAVSASFGLAAFIVKLFLNASYIWPIIAAAILPTLCIRLYAKEEIMNYLASQFPAVFFAHPAVTILPVQMVCFGSLGAVMGYWLAVAYRTWHQQQGLSENTSSEAT